MSAQISLTPMATTNAYGLFNTNSAGFTQGDAVDDPAVKFYLAGGILSTSATTPIWGGVPIIESIPTGICVFNQAYQGITTPQSTAPLYSPGMSIAFYRFGSGARIPMVCDSSIIALDGSSIVETVYYNYTTNLLTTTQPSGQAALPVKILKVSPAGTNKSVSYNGTTGNANWVNTDIVALCLI